MTRRGFLGSIMAAAATIPVAKALGKAETPVAQKEPGPPPKVVRPLVEIGDICFGAAVITKKGYGLKLGRTPVTELHDRLDADAEPMVRYNILRLHDGRIPVHPESFRELKNQLRPMCTVGPERSFK